MVMMFTRGARIVDEKTQDTLGRRFYEGIGLILLVLAVLLALTLGSFNPDDPSPFNATRDAATNLLGTVGSHLAGPFVFALGWSGWIIIFALACWGARLILHRGEERALSRLLMCVLAILLGSAFFSTHVPPDGWTHRFGLGGTIGDSLLTSLLSLLPIGAGPALNILTVVLAPVTLVLVLLGFGMNWSEFRAVVRFFALGTGLIIRSGFAIARRIPIVLGTGVALVGGLLSQRPKRQPVHRAEPQVAKTEQRREPILQRVLRSEIEEDVAVEADGENQQRLMARIAAAVQARKDTENAPVEPELTWDNFPPELGTPLPTQAMEPVPDLETPLDEPMAEEDPQAALPDETAVPLATDPEPVANRVQPRLNQPARVSQRAKSEAQPRLALGDADSQPYDAPPLSLLTNPQEIIRHHLSDDALEQNARLLESVLDDYGIRGDIVSVRPGPVVTMYELEPAPGLKASRVIGLADDIARSMSALAARVSTVPGRSVIGIELPNENREKVLLREILSAKAYGDSAHRLPLALGKDISGEPVVTNLARMPHLLIAGTTGSGKSVAINTMILSLLYRLGPKDCRLIMIDPKMLELSVYDGIPHLLSPVVTDPKKAVVALKWVVAEMEERYRKMSKMGVRNIDGFNARVRDALDKGEAFTRTVQTGFDEMTQEPIFETEEFAPEVLPFIVVIVDEMADLMMVAGKEIEACIQRLAQMARASGIHLIMATQRPSVDVITGTIKANFPTRISFQVTSKIDSRTILGEQGAEQLLGMGDMLYMAGGGRITRVHAPFCSDEEVEHIVHHLKSLGEPEYVSGVVEGPEDGIEDDINLVLGLDGNTTGEDALYDQAVAIIARDRKCSTSYVQRKLGIGYNKAARLVEQMEDQGIVSAANHVGKREILVPEIHTRE